MVQNFIFFCEGDDYFQKSPLLKEAGWLGLSMELEKVK